MRTRPPWVGCSRLPLKNPSRAAFSAADTGAMAIEIGAGLSALLKSRDPEEPVTSQVLSLYLKHVQTSGRSLSIDNN